MWFTRQFLIPDSSNWFLISASYLHDSVWFLVNEYQYHKLLKQEPGPGTGKHTSISNKEPRTSNCNHEPGTGLENTNINQEPGPVTGIRDLASKPGYYVWDTD